MSFIQQFFTSRDNNANAETFVGQQGRLWWDPVSNQIYSSDGNTPGGIPLAGGGGGNGTPGGSNSQVQFNNNGSFGGTANLTINSTTGALTAVSFVGDGSGLYNITGANVVGEVAYAAVANSVAGSNVTGTVANATYADTAGSATTATSAVTAGTVTTNAQPNITSVGTLSSVSVTGNVDSGGLYVGGSGVVTGNLQIQGTLTYNNLTNITTANLVFGLANTSTGVSANGAGWVVGNTNQASWLYNFGTQQWDSNIGISAIGNIIGSNITTGGLISATGNITTANLISSTRIFAANGTLTAPSYGFSSDTDTGLFLLGDGNLAVTTNAGTRAIVSDTGLAVTGVASATGNVTGGNLRTAGLITATGNVTVGNVLTGGLISATGNITGGNISTAGLVTATGNITGGNVIATTTVYGNASTAFVAGTAAISGVALQMPQEGALRNLNNGSTNMYFDVSTGGSTNGQFQFRSSNAFTNVLTMSPTAFNVNTEAVVTAKTASFGRLAWNSAIDTELTIDNYRFRVSNQGGIFPQVISNTGGTVNSAWTVVAARSGSAITQTGSTGTLVPNNSWTSLYTSGGMDSAGDTYVATLQDKSAGRIYRVTFMRSDNGATTGYNIIAERLI